MSYKIYELLDRNRGGIQQDFTDGEEIRKSWWALQPYQELTGDDIDDNINPDFVDLVEGRDNFILDRPIFKMFALAEEFKRALGNISGYVNEANDGKKFFKNMIDLQESLIKHGFYEGDVMLFEEDRLKRLEFVFEKVLKMPIGSIYSLGEVMDYGDNVNSYMNKNPKDKQMFEFLMKEDGSAKFSTAITLGQDDFPAYNQNDTTPPSDNDLDANSVLYKEDLEYSHVDDATEDEFELSEERTKAWIPGSKSVNVKKKCKIGGLGDTSAACNQGDISNLEFGSLSEEIIPFNDEDFDVEYDSGEVSNQAYELARVNNVNILSGKNLTGFVLKDNQVIGAIFSEVDSDEYSFDVVVDSKYRGTGIGKELIQFGINDYESYKDVYGDNLRLNLDVINPVMRSLLKKHFGFQDGQKTGQDRYNMSLSEYIEPNGGYMVYHGSNHKIERFSDEFVGAKEATDQEGPGIYLTTSVEDAQMYGNYIHTVNITPRKLIDESSHEDISEDEIITLIKKSSTWEDDALNWSEDPEMGVYEAISSLMQYSQNEKDLFQQIWYDWFRYQPQEFVRGMVELGYDGQIINRSNGIKHIIMYNPNAIEIKDVEKVNNVTNENFSRIFEKIINEELMRLGENKGIMELQDLPFKNDIYELGGKIYSVGGAVRDEFLGSKSKDLDILVTGIPMDKLSEIMSKYGKVDAVGKSFGILKFRPPEGEEVDVALPRTEKATGEGGHKGFEVTSDHTLPIQDDLRRRDFTINAIAKDINGNVIDPFSGMQDIQNKVIRVVNPEAFSDDPLRMLRAVQFAARFDFQIEPKTLKMIQQSAPRIKEIPPERILIELEKIVSKGDPSKGAFHLKNTRLFQNIFGKDAPMYAGPNWDNVKTMAEFMYLLTHHVLESPSEFFKNELKGDLNTQKELRALELAMKNESTEPVKNRATAYNVYKISPKALKSKLLPRGIQHAGQEFETGRYPKTIGELDIDGNDLKRFGLEGAEIGNTLTRLLINVYADKVKNTKQDLINVLGYIPSENLNESKK